VRKSCKSFTLFPPRSPARAAQDLLSGFGFRVSGFGFRVRSTRVPHSVGFATLTRSGSTAILRQADQAGGASPERGGQRPSVVPGLSGPVFERRLLEGLRKEGCDSEDA